MDKKIIKSIIFSVVFLAVSVLFWRSLSEIFNEPSVNALIFVVVGLIVWAAVLGIHCLIVRQYLIAYFTFILAIISFLTFFTFQKYYFIGLFILLLIMIWARSKIVKEANSRIKISAGKSIKAGISLILIFIFLFIAFVYYLNPPMSDQGMQLPRSWFKLAEGPIEGVVRQNFPVYIPGMTVDDISTVAIIQEQGRTEEVLASLTSKIPEKKVAGASPEELMELVKTDPEIQKILLEEIRKETKKINPTKLEKQRQELSKTFGVDFEGTDSIVDGIYKLANQKVNQFIMPYQKYIPLILAVVLFMFLQTISIIIKPLVLSLAEILFIILYWTRFVRIGKETKEAEVIEL